MVGDCRLVVNGCCYVVDRSECGGRFFDSFGVVCDKVS